MIGWVKPIIKSSNNAMRNNKFTTLFGFLFLIATMGISEAQTLNVENLQTEYRINPVGIDVEQPRFSWIIRTDERNILQNAYRLQVAKGEDNFETAALLIHDTDRVETGQSIHQVYRSREIQTDRPASTTGKKNPGTETYRYFYDTRR